MKWTITMTTVMAATQIQPKMYLLSTRSRMELKFLLPVVPLVLTAVSVPLSMKFYAQRRR